MARVIWPLRFRSKTASGSDGLPSALERARGVSPTVVVGEWSGNPRDAYAREVKLCWGATDGEQPTIVVSYVETTQYLEGAIDGTEHVSASLEGGTFTARAQAWERLARDLAALGFEDRTLEGSPAPIIDDLRAAGEHERAARLSRDITAALVRSVPGHRSVTLVDTRPDDLDAVLRAYVRPEDIVTIGLTGLGLRALPPDLSRFPRVRILSLDADPYEHDVLRGWSFPVLDRLSLRRTEIRALSAADVACAPLMTFLAVSSSPLDELDPEILTACPRLRVVGLWDTPLARDARKIATLRERWPTVRIEGVHTR